MLLIDGKNLYYPLYRSLAKDYCFYGKKIGVIARKRWATARIFGEKAQALKALYTDFWREVGRRERLLRRELGDKGRVVTIWDNAEVQTKAKQEEQVKRQKQSNRAGRSFLKAKTLLETFYDSKNGHVLRPTKKRRWKSSDIGALETYRRRAWTQFAFPSLSTSKLDYAEELRIRTARPDNIHDHAAEATDAEWNAMNTHLEASDYILSMDEADNTIVLLARIARLRHPHSTIIVLSQDGDFLIREDISVYRWTISYRFKAQQPWMLTDRMAVRELDSKLFSNIAILRIAGSIAGQDYTGVGLRGISWNIIAQHSSLIKVMQHYFHNCCKLVIKFRSSGISKRH